MQMYSQNLLMALSIKTRKTNQQVILSTHRASKNKQDMNMKQ